MKKQLFLLLATTIVATTFAGCSCTGSKTATDTTTESTVESTTPTKNENATEPEQSTTTVADIETDSNITEIETTVEEPTTEQPTEESITEAPTEAPTIEKEPEVKKDYEIVWSSNPYFFTKKFSDGTEKYYFTYRANIEMSGKETTAIGVIPPEEIPYLDYEPDYYINGQTGNPYADSTQDESTKQQTSGNTGNNQTEQETEQPTYNFQSGQKDTMTEEEWQKWNEEHGVTFNP